MNLSSWNSGHDCIKETFVVFDKGDQLGYILGVFTLLPIFLIVSYVTLLVCRRDFATVFAFFGQIGCLAINKILKFLIDQPRPLHNEFLDSGMPSNHAQFMGFFCAYLACNLLLSESSRRFMPLERWLYSLLCAVGGLIVCYSRIYLRYHTAGQVLVGLSVGIAVGAGWYFLDVAYSCRVGKYICSHSVVRRFGIAQYDVMEDYWSLRKRLTKLE
jgi:dolichyldiphosphatase